MNNKHTCQISAAVVKYIWVLLREPEHTHSYAKILIGFRQPSYSRRICSGTGLPRTRGATESGWPRASCRGAQHRPPRRAATAGTAKSGLAGTDNEDKPGTAQSAAIGTWALPTWERFRRSLCRVLGDPEGCAPQTLQGVQALGQKCSSLAYTASKHQDWNAWLWNINTGKPDIKQLETLKTKIQKLPLKITTQGTHWFWWLFFYLIHNLKADEKQQVDGAGIWDPLPSGKSNRRNSNSMSLSHFISCTCSGKTTSAEDDSSLISLAR